jgi:hypothetical protein
MNASFKASILTFALLASACGSGTIDTSGGNNNNGGNGNGVLTTSESFALATTTLNAFALGGDFPPEIAIPKASGMQSTAFIANFAPAGVIPIDLNSNPLKVSEQFATLDVSTVPEAAFPNHIRVISTTSAFLLGGGGMIYYNPTSGAIFDKVNLTAPIDLTEALPLSGACDYDFDTVAETEVGPGAFSPNFTGDLQIIGNRAFISMSSSCFDAGFNSFYVQGLVLVYDINTQPPFLTRAATPYIVLSGFNATGLTVANGKLIATSTGDTALGGAGSTPETPSFLDEIDPNTLSVTRTLEMGEVALNFHPLALSADGKRGFIGSSTFSEVYEIDLPNFSALRGENNPIQITDESSDFISDQEIAEGGNILFVSSFNRSAVNAVDLTSSERSVLPSKLDFSFADNPGVTGAGPMAIRPGTPGLDFNGPDLFVLTASPGTVSTATTY